MTHIAKPILSITLKGKDCTIQAMVENHEVIKSENCLNKMAVCTFDYCSHSTEKRVGGERSLLQALCTQNKNNEKSYADSQKLCNQVSSYRIVCLKN